MKKEIVKKLLIMGLLLPLTLWAIPFHTKQQIKEISASVVKIYTTSVNPDYYRPWQKGTNKSSSGTGVIIDNHMILTAAHVVTNGTFMQVKKSNDAKKYITKVKWIDHEADLALLEVTDTSFFENTVPQTFGGLPSKQDGVVVYGYPMGGDELSTTKGIVSRIEQHNYAHSSMDHITIQIDAPINPGNSGGPAFDSKGKIVGIAIQGLTKAEGIGYLVPVEVIKHFFEDIKDETYDGYADDGIGIQLLANNNIREYYHLGNRSGVLVSSVTKNSSADGFLHIGDVLLEADGVDIANDNTIKLKGNGRISANYLVRAHQVGEILHLKILRNKNEMHIEVPLKGRVNITPILFEKEPRYYLFGGMIFMPLTINYLNVWGTNWYTKAPLEFIYLVLNKSAIDRDIDELVVLSNMLPNSENANYSLFRAVVKEVNGKKVTSFTNFVKIIEQSTDQYINILLNNGMKYILNKDEALKSDIETMEKYGIGKKQRL